ncbi:MAG: Na+/H+ antiporter NhaC family protein [Clostridiales bacterium]|nr:Na+/H+ antiporter NhaC family protein [Clostridiales bacterium]
MNLKMKSWQRIALVAYAIIAVALIAIAPGTFGENGAFGTAWSLLPPVLAIGMALITKEVYISLFVGILSGAFLAVGGFCHPMAAIELSMGTVVEKLGDSGNVGILIFLVFLGAIVALINKAGGSRAYGEWARAKIKERKHAQLMTFLLGVLIFVDDYFNCLTVGSVMRPVTDSHKISRAKLAYIIDATAAPVCIIAPISSWAAAVSGMVEGTNGLTLFIRAIPYNYYALLTLLMVAIISLRNCDFGLMKVHEDNARYNNDLFTTGTRPYEDADNTAVNTRGKIIDLVMPVIALIVSCVLSLMYTGGFFAGESIIDSFANASAPTGLMLGSLFAIAFTLVNYMFRRVMTFREFADCLAEGFKAMVPAILILTLAWSIGGITKSSLGAPDFVANLLDGSAQSLKNMLPAIIFVISLGLAFATGTSWGTFTILIPIVVDVFPLGSELLIIAISACLAGAVCGDHISPISDTTIMASAGAQCDHLTHVYTQLPYAMLVAGVCFVTYIFAGLIQNVYINLLIGVVLMVGVLWFISRRNKQKDAVRA